jgi:hypothetical protein
VFVHPLITGEIQAIFIRFKHSLDFRKHRVLLHERPRLTPLTRRADLFARRTHFPAAEAAIALDGGGGKWYNVK